MLPLLSHWIGQIIGPALGQRKDLFRKTLTFVQWYNEEYRHRSIRYVTPVQRHRGEDAAIPAARQRLYEAAEQPRPERWSGAKRNWTPIHEVWLNPPPDQESEGSSQKKVA